MTIGMQAVLMWAALFVAGFLGHLVGDYLIQNNWMAQNKARPLHGFSLWPGSTAAQEDDETLAAITAHAITWAVAVTMPLMVMARLAWGLPGMRAAFIAGLILMVIHWIQDRRWPIQWFMRVTGKDPSVVWLLIVVDIVWHLLQIAGAAAWIVWRMTA